MFHVLRSEIMVLLRNILEWNCSHFEIVKILLKGGTDLSWKLTRIMRNSSSSQQQQVERNRNKSFRDGKARWMWQLKQCFSLFTSDVLPVPKGPRYFGNLGGLNMNEIIRLSWTQSVHTPTGSSSVLTHWSIKQATDKFCQLCRPHKTHNTKTMATVAH